MSATRWLRRCAATGCPERDPDRQRQGVHRPVRPAAGGGVVRSDLSRERDHASCSTQPRSPTTTGKIERFHRSLRAEFRTDRVFADLAAAQAELDAWVDDYNHRRPHQAIGMDTPGERFHAHGLASVTALRPVATCRPDPARGDGVWVARRASKLGVVCVSWQQVCLGVAAAGRNIDVWVTRDVMQFFDGDQLLRTETANHQRRSPQKTSIRARRTSHNLNNE